MQEKTLYTVVVADDEDELRQAVCQMTPWEELGFRLVGDANNGLDALELVEKLEPDLLLTDIRMPFISGIELAREVREIRPSMHIAFLTGFDDFEYAKQAIQYNIISYMLKPLTTQGLSEELRRIHEKIDQSFAGFRQQEKPRADRESFLMPLLLDEYAYGAQPEGREEALRRGAVESGLLRDPEDRSQFTVMLTVFTNRDGVNRTEPTSVHAVAVLAEKYLRHVCFYAGGKVVTLLLGTAGEFKKYVHILADEQTQMAERVLLRHCGVGVSQAVGKLSDLHAAYREAVEALSCNRPGESSVHFITDVRYPVTVDMEVMALALDGVVNACRSGDKAALAAALDQMVGPNPSRNWLDTAALQVVSEVSRLLYSVVGSEAMGELRDQGKLPELGMRYTSPQALRESLTQFCSGAMDLMSSQQKKGGSLICRRALEVIDQNYMDEGLSLVSLSGMLDVSPNYLSACLKKAAGESFINLLIKRRMDVAQELLRATSLKIQEVAARCGYSDQHYFSYCFKKYCGISPNALRRQLAEKSVGE